MASKDVQRMTDGIIAVSSDVHLIDARIVKLEHDMETQRVACFEVESACKSGLPIYTRRGNVLFKNMGDPATILTEQTNVLDQLSSRVEALQHARVDAESTRS